MEVQHTRYKQIQNNGIAHILHAATLPVGHERKYSVLLYSPTTIRTTLLP